MALGAGILPGGRAGTVLPLGDVWGEGGLSRKA